MTTTELKRKLAAILSADVKGYSHLTGEDEEWTFRTLNAYRGSPTASRASAEADVVISPSVARTRVSWYSERVTRST